MFVLAEIEDTVKIVPNDFGKNDNDAITDALNEKYANKVILTLTCMMCLILMLVKRWCKK